MYPIRRQGASFLYGIFQIFHCSTTSKAPTVHLMENVPLIDDDSLANRYRPRRLVDVVGQEAVIKVLMAQNRSGSHHRVKMFSGPSGCGKTTIARALAAFELCENPNEELGDACGDCDACLSIIDGRKQHSSVQEHDASSNTSRKEEIERLVARFSYLPMQGDVQVFILDEAHGMSRQAQDALLIHIENLAEHNRIYLLTTDPDSVSATIRGRAQHFPLTLPSSAAISAFLMQIAESEGWNLSKDVADLIVELTPDNQGVRQAVTNLSKLAAFFEDGDVSLADASNILGHVDLEHVNHILDSALSGDAKATVAALEAARAETTSQDLYKAMARELRVKWRESVASGKTGAPYQQMLKELVGALQDAEFIDMLGELMLVRVAQHYAPVAEQEPVLNEDVSSQKPTTVVSKEVTNLSISAIDTVKPEDISSIDADKSADVVESNDAVKEEILKVLRKFSPAPAVAITLLTQFTTMTVTEATLIVTVKNSQILQRFDEPKHRDPIDRAAHELGYSVHITAG